MAEQWTLQELVEEVSKQIAALPPPRNGQVRALPDERTVRYYGTIGLLDRPAMRGRTAIYDRRHVAQVVAIKRLQQAGRSLADIQALWPTLDDVTLGRMSGVKLDVQRQRRTARSEFWKAPPAAIAGDSPVTQVPRAARLPASAASPAGDPPAAPLELRVELAPDVILLLSSSDDSIAISPADVRAIRAAAAPLVAELARRRLTPDAAKETP